MIASDLSVINSDISDFFGGTSEVLKYISQEKLNYISLFKGYMVTVNSWDLSIDLSIFNILLNSPITVINNDNEYSYSRICKDNIFGLEGLDKDIIFKTPHAGFILITFKSNIRSVVLDSYLLVWISHKIKDSDLSRLISYSITTNKIIENKIQDKHEIYLSTYYLDKGDIYYKYLPGLISINKSYDEIYLLGEEFDYNQNTLVLYPDTGWYIFYQTIRTQTGTKVYPLDLYELKGLGYRRLRFNKSGSIFINDSNKSLQIDTSNDNNITSNNNTDLSSTDRYIRLEGYLVYKKAADCININISTGVGTVNVFDSSTNNCGDILTTAIFGDNSFNKTDFLDTEIFIDEDSFLNECLADGETYPTQAGFCINKNKSVCGFNITSEASSITYNQNNTLSSSRLVVYFRTETINANISVLNTLLNIGNTFNLNITSAIGDRGKLSTYGTINNTNISTAISTIPFNPGFVACSNKNVSSGNFTFNKGLVATCINKQNNSSSIQRRVIGGSTLNNTNISLGDSFRTITSSNGLTTHINISVGEGLSGQLLSGSILHENTSIAEDLIVSYQGNINVRNNNDSNSTSSVRYLAPRGVAININNVNIVI